MQPSKRLLIFLGMSGAAIFLVLITILREQINTFLVKPFLVLINSVSEFAAIFNQNIIWISFLIIFSLIMLIVIFPFKKRKTSNRNPYPFPLSRLSTWRKHLTNFSKGNYLKWRFGQRMSFLILKMIALKYNLPDKNLIYTIDPTNIDLPEYLHEYITATHQPYLKAGKPRKIFYPGRSDKNILESVTPEMVVSYLEEELLIEPINQHGMKND